MSENTEVVIFLIFFLDFNISQEAGLTQDSIPQCGKYDILGIHNSLNVVQRGCQNKTLMYLYICI